MGMPVTGHNHSNTIGTAVEREFIYASPLFITIQEFRKLKYNYQKVKLKAKKTTQKIDFS